MVWDRHRKTVLENDSPSSRMLWSIWWPAFLSLNSIPCIWRCIASWMTTYNGWSWTWYYSWTKIWTVFSQMKPCHIKNLHKKTIVCALCLYNLIKYVQICILKVIVIQHKLSQPQFFKTIVKRLFNYTKHSQTLIK